LEPNPNQPNPNPSGRSVGGSNLTIILTVKSKYNECSWSGPHSQMQKNRGHFCMLAPARSRGTRRNVQMTFTSYWHALKCTLGCVQAALAVVPNCILLLVCETANRLSPGYGYANTISNNCIQPHRLVCTSHPLLLQLILELQAARRSVTLLGPGDFGVRHGRVVK